MSFYTTFKSEFGEEQYIQIICRLKRANIAKLRSSSHDLRVEKGRYTRDRYNTALKSVVFAAPQTPTSFASSKRYLSLKHQSWKLRTTDHVLTECPSYHSLRSNLSDNTKSLIMLKEYGAIMNSSWMPSRPLTPSKSSRESMPER